MQIKTTEIDKDKRLDVFLSETLEDFSRSYIKTLIENGKIFLDQKKVKSGEKLKANQIITFNEIIPQILEIQPEKIDFEIVFEDENLVVINKPQGLVVHPCSSTKSGTLVNGLMEKIKDLSGINGVLRPGIIHRLDKDTSGLMLVAKNDFAHRHLAEQIKNKTCKRCYLALLDGHLERRDGRVETFIERDKKNRLKMTVSHEGKLATTDYKVIKYYEKNTLVEFSLQTGRTHQIRVHSAFLKHPVVGDKVYGKPINLLKGQLLHSYKIEFTHPVTNEKMSFEKEPNADFKNYLLKLKELKI